MISSIFFIIFVLLFLMSQDMFLIFISCIIILNLLYRKVVIERTFLIQKSLNFNIFLLSSKIISKIINFLNFLTSTIFLRTINVFLIFDLCVKIIISAALILCIHFIFCFSLIYIINFISLLDFRFERTLISRKKNVEVATFDCLTTIFVQIFSLIVSFVFSIILFNFLIIFFNFIICLSKQSFIFFCFAYALVTRRVFYYIKKFCHHHS